MSMCRPSRFGAGFASVLGALAATFGAGFAALLGALFGAGLLVRFLAICPGPDRGRVVASAGGANKAQRATGLTRFHQPRGVAGHGVDLEIDVVSGMKRADRGHLQ